MRPAAAWTLAARPATLTAAATPVIVGSSLALIDDAFRLDAMVIALFSALAIQVGVNFANDANDAKRGADSDTRIGPIRAVSSGLLTHRQMMRGVWVAFGLATLGGVYLTSIAGWVIVAIGLSSMAAALTYTGGPRPYGYHALGEVSVFIFFGLVATVGSRYVHDRSVPAEAWWLAVPLGLLITAILVANNVRDLESDRAAGKRTLAVVIGREASRNLFAMLILGAALLTAVAALTGVAPGWTALGIVAFIAAPPLIRVVSTSTEGPPLVKALESTARLQAVYGALIALGLVITASL